MALLSVPQKIRWGAGLADTIWLPFVEDPTSYPVPGEDFEVGETPSGYRTAWAPTWKQRLAETVRWIPPTDTLDPYATGWDGAKGWSAFLMSAGNQVPFAFHADARNLYASPLLSADANADGVADGHVIFRSISATAYAISDGAQRITASFTGGNQLAGVQATYQPPAWVGMPPVTYSLDAKITRAGATVGNLNLVVRREFRNAANAMISFAYLVMAVDPNSADYTRYSVMDSAAAPAGTASVSLYPALRSMVDATASGTVAWLKNVQMEWGGGSAFVNSELHTMSYLVAPIGERPAKENDGTRRINLEIQSVSGTPYTGF